MFSTSPLKLRAAVLPFMLNSIVVGHFDVNRQGGRAIDTFKTDNWPAVKATAR
jgi:hypothetical protein